MLYRLVGCISIFLSKLNGIDYELVKHNYYLEGGKVTYLIMQLIHGALNEIVFNFFSVLMSYVCH